MHALKKLFKNKFALFIILFVALFLSGFILVPSKKEICGDGFEPYRLQIKCFHPSIFLWARLFDEYNNFIDPYK